MVLNSAHRGVTLQRIDFNQPPNAVRPPQIIYDSEAAGRQEAVRMLVTLGTAPPGEGVDTLTQGLLGQDPDKGPVTHEA